MTKPIAVLGIIFIALVLSFSLLSNPISAQGAYRIAVDYIDTQHFPMVDAFVSVTDPQGFLVSSLTSNDFSVSEDNRPVIGFKALSVENTQQPLAVVLVLDTSATMNTLPLPTPLSVSISAAKTFITSLGPQDQMAIIGYSDSPTVISDFTQDKNSLGQALDKMQGGNGVKSAMFDAIQNAVGLLNNRSERRVVILITDGKDTHSQTTVEQAISAANQAGVQIYALGFGAVNHDQIYALSEQTGGSWMIQPNSSGLPSAFNNILQILRRQYQIEYSSVLPADNQNHSFMVSVTLQGAQISSSKRFIAQPRPLIITLPYQNGQTVGGNVIFTPQITGPAPTSQLDILLDGTLLTSKASEPFAFTWNSTTVTAGMHEFKFKATDQLGNVGDVVVDLNVQPPLTVKITKPREEDTVQGSTSITVAPTLLAGDSLAKIVVSIDGQTLNTLTTEPYEAKWDLTTIPPGKHTIQVTATDISGFSAQDQVMVYVQGENSGIGPLVIIGVAALLAVIIPVAVRTRKRRKAGTAQPSVKVRTGSAVLRELSGMNPNQVWPLGTNELRLGRKRDENDIPLQGLSASRRHAVIRFENEQYVIHGTSQSNPVIVNGVPISQPKALQPGDNIQLGETILRYERSS